LGSTNALGNSIQIAPDKMFPAKEALDFSTCRFRKTGGLDQHNSGHLEIMLPRYTLAKSPDHRLCVKFFDVSTLDLVHHHKPFGTPVFNGKRHPAAWP
jgi:hypothetical protein